jgi:hypothetical protein
MNAPATIAPGVILGVIPGTIPGTIEAMEAELVQVLETAFPGLAVQGCPDDIASYRFTHRTGALLVHYTGSEFGPPKALDVVVADRFPSWEVHILARDLRAHGGAYGLLDAVRACLTGVRLAAASGRLHPTHEGMRDREDGVWHYAIALRCAAVLVQQDEDDRRPLLDRIRFHLRGASGDADIDVSKQGENP